MIDGIVKRKIALFSSVIVIVSLTTFAFQVTQSFYKLSSLGEKYAQKADYRLAAAFLISALKIKPNDLKTSLFLLGAYEKLGNKKEAISIIKIIQGFNPRNTPVLEQLADASYRLKNYPKAEELYCLALSGKKDKFDTQKKLVEVIAWQKKYQQAISLIEEMSGKGKDSSYDELLADVYLIAKKYDLSAGLYRKAIASGKYRPDAVLKLADALRLSGRNEEALELYRQYLQKTGGRL